MASIFVEQNLKIKSVIEEAQRTSNDDVLDVIKILLGRMEYSQKRKIGADVILKEYFSVPVKN